MIRLRYYLQNCEHTAFEPLHKSHAMRILRMWVMARRSDGYRIYSTERRGRDMIATHLTTGQTATLRWERASDA